MRLHQLKIDFAPEQDRMLMLIAASEQVEVRMWLTRRGVVSSIVDADHGARSADAGHELSNA